jgi:hypothetical protein
MTDPTLATVDEEPWNQFPRRPTLKERQKAFAETAPILHGGPARVEPTLSINERVKMRIPILTPTDHAQFVYDLHGHTTKPHTCKCGAFCGLSCWTEFEYTPKDPTARKHRRDYRITMDLELCNRCSNALRALPLGERWTGPKR